MSMNRLRPRQRLVFSGFSTSEVDKMEKILMDLKQPLDKEIFQKIARSFNSSSGRAGKPIVKWKEVESWFKCRQEDNPSRVASSTEVSKDSSLPAEANDSNKEKASSESPETKGKMPDISEWEFEARSSKDGAWYDVESFLAHRFVKPGEAEALVRFVGFGAEEDEWVNVKDAVRERSVPLENSECNDLKAGDLVCCFQERRDQAIYYDAHIANIERRMHDIRGCRCLFLIRYNHDNTEERVRLRRLCRRPTH